MDLKVRGQASELDRRMGDKLKSVRGNLQTMAEKGGVFKTWQTKQGLFASILPKNILVDCTYINSMLKIPVILNVCQTIQSTTLEHPNLAPPRHIYPCINTGCCIWIFFYLNQISTKINKTVRFILIQKSVIFIVKSDNWCNACDNYS